MELQERLELIRELKRYLAPHEKKHDRAWAVIFTLSLASPFVSWQVLGDEWSFWGRLLVSAIVLVVFFFVIAIAADPDEKLKKNLEDELPGFYGRHADAPDTWREVTDLLRQWADGTGTTATVAKELCAQLRAVKLMDTAPAAEAQLQEQMGAALAPAGAAAPLPIPAPVVPTPLTPTAKPIGKGNGRALDDQPMAFIPLEPDRYVAPDEDGDGDGDRSP